jgi:hypothetical protein
MPPSSLVALLVAWLTLVSIIVVLACSNDPTMSLHSPSLGDLQTRATGHLGPCAAYPWPKGTNRLLPGGGVPRNLRYYFANEAAKRALWCKVKEGLTNWANAIGWDHLRGGHSVTWQEAGDDWARPEQVYCYLNDYESFGNPGTWNPQVKEDTLAIHLSSTPAIRCMTTVGWQPTRPPAPAVPSGWHYMILEATISAAVVTHEVSLVSD